MATVADPELADYYNQRRVVGSAKSRNRTGGRDCSKLASIASIVLAWRWRIERTVPAGAMSRSVLSK